MEDSGPRQVGGGPCDPGRISGSWGLKQVLLICQLGQGNRNRIFRESHGCREGLAVMFLLMETLPKGMNGDLGQVEGRIQC